MSLYGRAILHTLPPQSILLSHTDLDWNTVRYHRLCRPRDDNYNTHKNNNNNVTHLSLQILPYPWFRRQRHIFYPHISFPKILPNASTNIRDKGHTLALLRFLSANAGYMTTNETKGGIYIDMQAVYARDIGPMGSYHGFTLLPWGLVYRVLPLTKPSPKEWRRWTMESSLTMMEVVTDVMGDIVMKKTNTNETSVYEKGSWEFVATSVFWDMHYQLGLNYLSAALGSDMVHMMRQDVDIFGIYVEALARGSDLLWRVDEIVRRIGTLSSPKFDVVKNVALSHMRYYEAFKILPKLKHHLSSSVLKVISNTTIDDLVVKSKNSVSRYLKEYPDDGDVEVFRRFYETEFVYT